MCFIVVFGKIVICLIDWYIWLEILCTFLRLPLTNDTITNANFSFCYSFSMFSSPLVSSFHTHILIFVEFCVFFPTSILWILMIPHSVQIYYANLYDLHINIYSFLISLIYSSDLNRGSKIMIKRRFVYNFRILNAW